jgi:hypothetical protein
MFTTTPFLPIFDDQRSRMVSALALMAACKHPEYLRDCNPEINDSEAADGSPNVAIGPQRMPDRLNCALYNPRKIIVAPTVGPRVDEQKKAQLEAKNDEQY